MRAAVKSNTRVAVRAALAAALAFAAGCSSAGAEEQAAAQAQIQTLGPMAEIWRCVARNAYYVEREGGQSATTKVVSGKLLFHSVTPGPDWASGVSMTYMSVKADPDMRHGNGITVAVRQGDPDQMHVSVVVDGEKRRLGSYPVGSPVPFKIIFDDVKGTMTVESGAFAMTAKPEQLQRPHFDMQCSGADVSFYLGMPA